MDMGEVPKRFPARFNYRAPCLLRAGNADCAEAKVHSKIEIFHVFDL